MRSVVLGPSHHTAATTPLNKRPAATQPLFLPPFAPRGALVIPYWSFSHTSGPLRSKSTFITSEERQSSGSDATTSGATSRVARSPWRATKPMASWLSRAMSRNDSAFTTSITSASGEAARAASTASVDAASSGATKHQMRPSTCGRGKGLSRPLRDRSTSSDNSRSVLEALSSAFRGASTTVSSRNSRNSRSSSSGARGATASPASSSSRGRFSVAGLSSTSSMAWLTSIVEITVQMVLLVALLCVVCLAVPTLRVKNVITTFPTVYSFPLGDGTG